VLAGGSGHRLAALTERLRGRPTPKQYCAFGSRHTLIQETLLRIAPLAPPHRITVVVQATHLDVARRQLRGFRGVTLLAQPSDCGTGTGLLLALVHVLERDPGALVLVTPSDHGVGDREAYARGIRTACAAAETAAAVLMGVAPDAPRTDYGWILSGDEVAPGVQRVLAFAEKPGPAALAARGGLFSTMVLVARGRALLALVERARPGIAAILAALPTLPEPARALHLHRAYALLPSCDFSRDILAAAENLAVVRWPAELGWTDLGTPDRVAAWLACDRAADRSTMGMSV